MSLSECETIKIRSLAAPVACAFLVACGTDLVVLGDEMLPDDSGAQGSSETDRRGGLGIGGGEPDCSEQDQAKLSAYEEWIQLENDVAPLAGKRYRGHLDAGPFFEIKISEEGEVRAIFGTGELVAPATDPDTFYLCPDGDIYQRCLGPYENVEYRVQGASYVGRRLQLPIILSSPWEQWCAMQEPQPTETACHYDMLGLIESGFTGTDGCEHNGKPVDCTWYTFGQNNRCVCNSMECFLNYEEESVLIDLTFTPDGKELNGSVRWPGGYVPTIPSPARVWLELVELE